MQLANSRAIPFLYVAPLTRNMADETLSELEHKSGQAQPLQDSELRPWGWGSSCLRWDLVEGLGQGWACNGIQVDSSRCMKYKKPEVNRRLIPTFTSSPPNQMWHSLPHCKFLSLKFQCRQMNFFLCLSLQLWEFWIKCICDLLVTFESWLR